MEMLLWKYPGDFFPNRGFQQFQKQYTLPSGVRFDLAFHDANHTLWVMEIKAVPLKIEVVNQVHGYAMELQKLHDQGPPPISMVISPSISPPVRAQLDYWGVAYEEIHEGAFRAVATKHGETLPDTVPHESAPPPKLKGLSVGPTGSKTETQAAFLRRLREAGKYPLEGNR